MITRPTDAEVKARLIREQTEMVLAELRRCQEMSELIAKYRTWQAYADENGIAKPIRTHVRDAVNETAITIKARRVVRDPTGEAA